MKTLVPGNFLLTHCRHKHFCTVQDPPDMLLLILRRALTADPLRKALGKGLLCHEVVEVLQPTEGASTCQLNSRIEFIRHMKQLQLGEHPVPQISTNGSQALQPQE